MGFPDAQHTRHRSNALKSASNTATAEPLPNSFPNGPRVSRLARMPRPNLPYPAVFERASCLGTLGAVKWGGPVYYLAFETNAVGTPLIRPCIETSETAPGVFLSELRASRDVASQIARCVIFKDRLRPCCQEPSLTKRAGVGGAYRDQ